MLIGLVKRGEDDIHTQRAWLEPCVTLEKAHLFQSRFIRQKHIDNSLKRHGRILTDELEHEVIAAEAKYSWEKILL